MADDLRQRLTDAVLPHLPKDQYPGAAALAYAAKLADIAITARDSDPGYWRERAEKAENANAGVRALHPSCEEAEADGNVLCLECAQPAPCRTRTDLDDQEADRG